MGNPDDLRGMSKADLVEKLNKKAPSEEAVVPEVVTDEEREQRMREVEEMRVKQQQYEEEKQAQAKADEAAQDSLSDKAAEDMAKMVLQLGDDAADIYAEALAQRESES